MEVRLRIGRRSEGLEHEKYMYSISCAYFIQVVAICINFTQKLQLQIYHGLEVAVP